MSQAVVRKLIQYRCSHNGNGEFSWCFNSIFSILDVTTVSRGHGRSLYICPPTTFHRRDELDRPGEHCLSGWDPRFGLGGGSPTILGLGDAPPAFVSLILLTSNAEANPCPSCYACGQNFRQSDPPLACHTPAYGAQIHKQTRCSGCPAQNILYRGVPQPTAGRGH